jgi:SAM-dependent methyltransferase
MTEPSYLSAIRANYDTVAVDYAELLSAELARRPLDRAMVAAFAELVRAADLGAVADLGCGPGRVTAHLDALGVDAFGVDLSLGMVAEARRRHPELRFDEGSIAALELKDGVLGGIVAWYSIIHTPPELLAGVFAEFHRVLAPGGYLLLAFKAGDERRHLEHAYGHPMSLDVYWMPPGHIAELLSQAGFEAHARMLREPGKDEKQPQAFLLVRKPVAT